MSGPTNGPLIFAVNAGHDGAVAVVDGGRLIASLEAEKDSNRRYSKAPPDLLLRAAELVDRTPDVVAIGGWAKDRRLGDSTVAAGYQGDRRIVETRKVFGRSIKYYSSTHEMSHVMSAVGLAPLKPTGASAVLIWEGVIGHFILLDEKYNVVKRVPVMDYPGIRYQLMFAIADPSFPDQQRGVRAEDAGKLMALAAYGDQASLTEDAYRAVDQLLSLQGEENLVKSNFRDSQLFNCGLRSDLFTATARLLTQRIFDEFSRAARRYLPTGIPLYIAGGCGLNCDWNRYWRDNQQFSSMFVPPCANDSGSAIGTALDAQNHFAGTPSVEWSVYSGLPFAADRSPRAAFWREEALDEHQVAMGLERGEVVAWVQGRCEIGPRALGNRSLLAAATAVGSRDRLNQIKGREDYRPIAPICLESDLAHHFDQDFPDPYMLYFREVTDPRLAAVTHVDGTARAQSVSANSNPSMHRLLEAVKSVSDVGVLCNTSLNFHGHGFINRTSDLDEYCVTTGVDRMVIDDRMYMRIAGPSDLMSSTPGSRISTAKEGTR